MESKRMRLHEQSTECSDFSVLMAEEQCRILTVDPLLTALPLLMEVYTDMDKLNPQLREMQKDALQMAELLVSLPG